MLGRPEDIPPPAKCPYLKLLTTPKEERALQWGGDKNGRLEGGENHACTRSSVRK